ncbi:MAG: 6-phosphogluconolactonase, partial [Spirochaetia bacterium]|nr:6-phosphogluconolactonase [Spirochaetia bacterium]
LSILKVPESNIFRIRGEKVPENEVLRYSKTMYETLPLRNGFPVFDMIYLGVGKDGHTASLFPMSEQLDEKEKAAVVSVSPENGRKRITLTLPVICNAERIIFLVTGVDKREIVRKICKHENEDPNLPASMVRTQNGTIEWYLDSVAWSSWEQDSDVF